MGKESIERPAKDNGAEGAYVPCPPDRMTIINAMSQTVDYFRIIGRSHATAKWIGSWFAEMRRIVDARFCEITEGHHLEEVAVDDVLRELWEFTRKKAYIALKADKPVRVPQNMPLFHIGDRSGVIYAASSTLATIPGRFIKIGFCKSEDRDEFRRDVLRYLRSKRLGHNPILMAHMPGDLRTEGKYHDDWKTLLADGREYYWPEERLAIWIKHTFAIIEVDFDLTFKAAVESHEKQHP